MCGRGSRLGSRIIVVSSLLFLLVVCPCCAAASWGAWFSGGDTQATDFRQESLQEEVTEEASSPTISTMQSETSKPNSSETLLSKVDELERQLEEAETSLTRLDESLEAMRQTEQISEADYQAVKQSLTEALPANAAQADRIAELEKEAGSKAYMLVGGFVGFEKNLPTYGLSLDIGVRIGSSLMLQTGVDYQLGSLAGGVIQPFSLDNMRFRAQIGWMW